MKDYPLGSIQAVVFLGQGGAGKTALAEATLFYAGAIDRLGSVGAGTTTMDFEPEEITRKISLSAAVGYTDWKNRRIYLIDTPGYMDFLEETRGCLRVADGGVLVASAVSGVKPEAARVWEYACAERVPCLLFINEMDKERANFDAALASVESVCGLKGVPLSFPFVYENSSAGVVDLLSMKAHVMSKGNTIVEKEIPEEMKRILEEKREDMIEHIAESNDALLERYLETGTLTSEEIGLGVKEATLHQTFLPVLCGSAVRMMGVSPLLEAISACLPLQSERREGEAVMRVPDEKAPFSAFVFKTIVDPFVGRLSYVRVMSGRLNSDSPLFNSTRKTKEKGGHLFSIQGKKYVPLAHARTGEVVAIAKLKETLTGDTLCDEQSPLLFPPLTFTPPLFSVAVEPKLAEDEEKVSTCIAKLLEEDPALVMHRDRETKEMTLSGMGQMHLEVLADKLKRKFGTEITMKPPKVPYKETVTASARVQGKYKRQTGGRGQYGDTWLHVEPLPKGSGFQFVDQIVGGAIPRQYIQSVEKGILEAMQEGMLAGYPVVDVRVTLYDGSYHPVDSSDIAFKMAASIGFKKAVEQCSPVLLEPIMKVEITTPEEYLGAIIGDLNSRRGRIMGVEPQKTSQRITATVPLSEMLIYAPILSSLSGGRGLYTMSFSCYEEVPTHIAARIIEERKKTPSHA